MPESAQSTGAVYDEQTSQSTIWKVIGTSAIGTIFLKETHSHKIWAEIAD